MLDEIIAFLLSLGIVGALIAWGFVCGVWHRHEFTDERMAHIEPFRDRSPRLAERCEK